jgi:hypothetical protein
MTKKLMFIVICIFLRLLNSGIAQQIDIPRIEQMPDIPDPYEMRDWKTVALGYDSLVFDFSLSGEHLPLIWLNTQTINYPDHNSFGLHTAVGTYSPGNAEAINILPAVVGATLVGIDKSDQNSNNWVLMSEEFFNTRPEENVYLNGTVTYSGNDWWYDTMPNIFFYQLYDMYPGTGDFAFQFTSVADQWLKAVESMGGDVTPWRQPDMDYRAFSLSTMTPLQTGVRQPEAAGAIAWLLYNDFVETGDDKYRIGAEWCLEFLSTWSSNPSYELQLPYGVYAAARMNAEIGTSYNIYKLINWCFTPVGNVRGWGMTLGNWGGYDCYGLIGEAEYDGYAFIMNGFEHAGALVPAVRYDDRFARAIGKWMLHLSNASRLFYTKYLPDENQDGESWSKTYDPGSYIAHEAMREFDLNSGNTPFASGDFFRSGWGATNYVLYGSSHVGIFGGIIDTTNIEMILQLDVLKTDYFGDESYPTFLYYNPYDTEQSVIIDVGSGSFDLYDAVNNEFVQSNISGVTTFNIAADAAALIVVTPAGGEETYDLDKMLIDGVVVDYMAGSPVSNYPPRIKSLAFDPQIVPRTGQTSVFCSAEDKDEDPLTYNWSCSHGSFEENDATVTWNAPDSAGIFEVFCVVMDGGGAADTSSVMIEVLLNRNPQIEQITADPSEIEKMDYTTLTCIASDPDEDTLTYTWSNDSSVVIWTAPDAVGYYYILCKVEDGRGGETTDSVGVSVGKLAAHYPFDGNAMDMSGYDNHGFVSGAVLVPDRNGVPNSAYYFDGVDDYIRVPNHPSLNFVNGITVNFWMRIDEFFKREAHPVSHGSWKNRWKISISALDAGPKVRWTVLTNSGIKDMDTHMNFNTNIFYYISCVYTQNRVEIYLNGQLETSDTFTGQILTTSIDFMIGQVLPGESNYNFKGILDDLRIYNYALSSTEIEDLYNQSTSIELHTEPGIPIDYVLRQNYPNPFNPTTVIRYQLPVAGDVVLTVFNLLGQKAATLFSGRQQAGYYSIEWDASEMASGIYYYKLEAGPFIEIKRMLLLK